MNKSILYIILCAHCVCFCSHAQSLPAEIRYETLTLRALRYYPEATDAADIMKKVVLNKPANDYHETGCCKYSLYQKTSIDVSANKQALDEEFASLRQSNLLAYKYLVKPYESWLKHARSPEAHPEFIALTVLLDEDYRTVYEEKREKGRTHRRGSILHAARSEGLPNTSERQKIFGLLDETVGDIDIYTDRNDLLSLPFKSPLSEQAANNYAYRLIGIKSVGEQRCYEIVFYCKNKKKNTWTGCLYISTDGAYSLVEARFTLDDPSATGLLHNILITHTYLNKECRMIPSVKKYSILLGDDVKGCLIIEREAVFRDFDCSTQPESGCWENRRDREYADRDEAYWSIVRPIAPTPAQEQIRALSAMAANTPAFRNLQKVVPILLYNRFPIGREGNEPFELGPVTQLIHYNRMEGLRLKIGGNTTTHLWNRLLVGGYVAYGSYDKAIKYRANLIYSLLPRRQRMGEHPRRLISFAYVNDLNIPGRDLLIYNHDHILNSFSDASIRNMSLQKIGSLTYEHELSRHLSFKVGGQYKYDEPKGAVRYMRTQGNDTTGINDVTTFEAQVSVRLSPINLSHRIGTKGLFGSDYAYQITELKAYKRLSLGAVGDMDVQLSAGKVWNRIPFPLLFIPTGNQSYIFETEDYNRMDYYEFVTDNYVAGCLDFMLNWSPMKLFNHRSKIRTSVGARMIYGPLSDNNNPDLHPELFVFNQGVGPLGNTPYAEAHIGLSNVFRFLRIEYARRLSYLGNDEKGSLLFGAKLTF